MRDLVARCYVIPGGASQRGGGPSSGVPCRTLSDQDSGRSLGRPDRDGFWHWYSNFWNRPYPLAQNRGTILMGIAVWRVTIQPKVGYCSTDMSVLAQNNVCAYQRSSVLGLTGRASTACPQTLQGQPPAPSAPVSLEPPRLGAVQQAPPLLSAQAGPIVMLNVGHWQAE